MKVFDLRCVYGHEFEGWFASEQAYEQQVESGFLECPLCGEHDVRRTPSAPRLNLSQADAAPPEPATGVATPQDLARDIEVLWLRTLQEVIEQTEDVGRDFAAEARRIHEGDARARAIRGQASDSELAELRSEDIEVMRLPLLRKDTLQ